MAISPVLCLEFNVASKLTRSIERKGCDEGFTPFETAFLVAKVFSMLDMVGFEFSVVCQLVDWLIKHMS